MFNLDFAAVPGDRADVPQVSTVVGTAVWLADDYGGPDCRDSRKRWHKK